MKKTYVLSLVTLTMTIGTPILAGEVIQQPITSTPNTDKTSNTTTVAPAFSNQGTSNVSGSNLFNNVNIQNNGSHQVQTTDTGCQIPVSALNLAAGYSAADVGGSLSSWGLALNGQIPLTGAFGELCRVRMEQQIKEDETDLALKVLKTCLEAVGFAAQNGIVFDLQSNPQCSSLGIAVVGKKTQEVVIPTQQQPVIQPPVQLELPPGSDSRNTF